jgi:Fe-S-cluster containining protein
LADLDMQEMKMFAKWHATANLADNAEFWQDCLAAYVDKAVTLPMYDQPAERESVLKLVRCPPGECGACCRYDRVALTRQERIALEAASRQTVNTSADEAGNMYMTTGGGCRFLKNNACTVYPQRPAVCAAFPVITARDAVTMDGTSLKQIRVKLKCPAALEVVKTIMTGVCAGGKVVLLPDLSLVPAYENGKGVLGSI